MTKIMLVEDDNNLREIYEARLAAEGFDIVAAPDGEAALALAAKEHPQLVITDVMMPKVSGFEMLDILRNTETLRDVKVIMLTALGQAEDNARAGALGADRYLVKSQVTLEDIVKAAHEVIGDETADATTANFTTPAAQPAAIPSFQPPAAVQPIVPVAPGAATGPTLPQPVVAAPVAPVALAAPVTSDDPLVLTGPAATVAAGSAASDIADSSADEEVELQNQIDQFLTLPTEPPLQAPVSASPTELQPVPQLDTADTTFGDENSNPIDLETGIGGQNLFAAPPHDEPETEYEKDASTPDMGTLALHEEPAAASVAEANVESAAVQAANSDQRIAHDTVAPNLPTSEPAIPPAPAAAGPSPNANVVANAIDSMMAQTTTVPKEPVLPPSEAWKQKDDEPADAPSESEQPAGSDTNPDDDDLPSRTKKVIAPLDHPEKPTIHQLLAMEEAKNSASQAASQTIAAPPVQPAAGPNPVDPNSIAL